MKPADVVGPARRDGLFAQTARREVLAAITELEWLDRDLALADPGGKRPILVAARAKLRRAVMHAKAANEALMTDSR